jgi:hypothetical protein
MTLADLLIRLEHYPPTAEVIICIPETANADDSAWLEYSITDVVQPHTDFIYLEVLER